LKNKDTLMIRSIKVPGLYVLFGFLWILFSDQLILLIAKDAEDLARMQTYKGWFFVLVTGFLLYLMIRHMLKSLKKTELTLSKSEERLSATLSSIGDGVISTDEMGRVISLNEVAEELTGWNTSEALGRPINEIFSIVNAQTRTLVDNPVEQCLREGLNVDLSNHTLLIRRDGSEYHIADSCAPIHNITGAVIGAVLVFRDVTKKYRQRQQLQDERERLASVLWGTGVGTWEWNVQTGETRFNDRWADMIGYSLAEISPVSIKTWERFLHPDDTQRVEEALESHFRGETDYYECECRMRHRAGHWIWVLDRGKITSWSESGQPLRMAGTHLNITDRKHAEETRRLSEERLQSVFRVAPTGIGVVRNRIFSEVNQRICEITGYTTEELIGKSSRMLYPSQKEYDFVGKTKYDQIMTTGTGVVETCWQRKDGSVRDIWLASSPLDPSDLSQGVTFTALDITDHKRAENALIESEARYRSLFENNHAVMLVLDPTTGAVVDANPAAASWYGWARDEFCQKNICDINKTLSPKELLAEMDRAANQQAGPFLFRHQRADGSLRDVEVFSGLVHAAGRSLIYSIIHDITEKKRTEQALEKRILALTRPLDNTSGMTFEDLFNREDIQRLQDDFAQATGVASIIAKPDGTPITAPSNFRRLCQDIVRKTEKGQTKCHWSDAQIGQPSDQGPILQRCLSAGLWDAGAAILVDGRHIASWLVGQVRDDTQDEEQIRAYAREIGADEGAMAEAFLEIPAMSGEQFAQVAQALYTLANQLSVSAYQNVQQARFITEQKQAQEKIAFLAHHDQLTRLPNRTLLAEHFELAAGHALRTDTEMALCVLDLDGFKAINDSHGHPQGDQLLCEVAQRLTESVRTSDTVCRIGGDEFVLLFTDLQKAVSVTALVQKTLECFEPAFHLAGAPHSISASMGVAVFPEDGDDFSTLFEHADAAMYFAKESGRNNVQFFRQEINQRVQQRLTIEKELRQALLDDQLELHYQPIIQLPEKRIAGMEALVRWRHPLKGLIPPIQFIPVAEESNLIVSLGQWVLKAACRDMAAWRKQGLPSLPVSVNISARQLFENDFAVFIKQTLMDYALPAQQLELEVTENIFLESSDSVETVMNDLKDIGVGLSLDDFGTGYSSLSYLKRFRIEKLKIDRSFMAQVCHSQQDAVLVKTIIRMAQNLGMQVVAEGVETANQMEFLIEQGCELAQGFFFSKPLPLVAIQELVGRSGTHNP
jgi:diguanylate cyclase (GGDEF)-like protein/PAS domain S-box-containing protein